MAGVGGEEGVELFLQGFWSDGGAAGTYRLVHPWESCPPHPTGGLVAVVSEDATASLPAPTNSGMIVGEGASPHEVEKLTLTMVRRGERVTSFPLVVRGAKVALPEGHTIISLQIHPVEARAIARFYENKGSNIQWKSTGLYTMYAISAEDIKSTMTTLKTDHVHPSAEQLFGKKTVYFRFQGCLDITFPPLKLDFEKNFQCEKQIGRGSEGKVYKCRSCFNSHYCAIKEVVPEQFFVRSIHCEPSDVSILSMLNHRNIVELYLSWSERKKSSSGHTTDTTFVSMKLCSRSLMEYLKERSEVDLESGEYIFKQIIAGLEYLHQHGVLHRDIKPGNVLLEDNLEVKLADFGIAKTKHPPDNITFNGGLYGSVPYRAPELINVYTRHDEKVDIFSAGMIYFEIFMPGVKERKYKLSQLSTRIREGMQEFDQKMIPFDLDIALGGRSILDGWRGNYNFLKMMTSPKGSERPSATEIMEMLDNKGEGLEH